MPATSETSTFLQIQPHTKAPIIVHTYAITVIAPLSGKQKRRNYKELRR
jgi:hypothetical protein